MIDRWIARVADYSLAHNPESPSRSVIIFVFRLLSNVVLTVVITLLVCTLTGHWLAGLIVVGTTVLIKIFIGSFHFHSIVACVIYSSGSMIMLAHIELADPQLLYLLSACTIALITLYAPQNISVFLKLQPGQIAHLKWAALALVAFFTIIQAPLAIGTCFFQAVSITPLFQRLFTFLERR
ncbi:accessory gene regulator B family protein [Paenibacillus athensensis]|uniref:Accessory gene regulator B n=1 Tax=Paenibacillus athensensis TaxID=1967502 RepID=A0A4Y8Q9U1_9BACL|nr:accessory gene regulator B family protein [Paenibacillus athensensis]MCD1259065.1 accessory gene regulator B family protein [Paenibacillus athensensis]